jgi:4-aminobutyrate aminotransferase
MSKVQELIPRVLSRYSPVTVDRGEGIHLWDTNGDRWTDFTSGIAVTNTGHSHPKVVEAIREQAGKMIHAQANILAHEPMLELVEKLTATMPGKLNSVLFSNSGAEAVEGAIKLAKVATGRPAVIAFRGAFHGRTHLAMALTTSKLKVRGHYEPLVPSIYYAPYPNSFRNQFNVPDEDNDLACLDELQSVFDTQVAPEDVAAIIIEPILGEGGYIVPPTRFMKKLRELCDQHGIMLVADEIQTGVGRTGKMWGFEHFDVVPDIVAVAKGLASGLPLSAVVANKEVMDQWEPGAHGGTFGGNVIACAAANATLDVMRDENLPENAASVGNFLMSQIQEMMSDNPHIGEVRGKGLMIGVEFVTGDGGLNAAAVQHVVKKGHEHMTLMITAGTHDQVIRLAPPLVINHQQAEEFLDVFADCIKDA